MKHAPSPPPIDPKVLEKKMKPKLKKYSGTAKRVVGNLDMQRVTKPVKGHKKGTSKPAANEAVKATMHAINGRRGRGPGVHSTSGSFSLSSGGRGAHEEVSLLEELDENE